ncbi:jerky protein homolog-like [Harmonia axyridis]|uniref:jerky protein homolog-like n=1 Tax=Harmonia axyridis TaxID=115357 RepID=UPI001E279B43|nr:jerky protein homolog-like [Harmonia axyridis]
MNSKRKKVVLTIEEKLQLIEEREKGHNIPFLANSHNIGLQTVRDILKQKDKLLHFASRSDSLKGTMSRKTTKKPNFEELDNAVYEWFQQKRVEGHPISGPLLLDKAKWFHTEMKIEKPFQASQGWLLRFKKRHGIRQLDIQGEKLSADNGAAELFLAEFKRLIERYDLSSEQVYNADETGLFWKSLPSKTLAMQNEKSAPGHKCSKERITLMPCSNASGNHKLQLLCIGKSKTPRSFKGTEMKNFPVRYQNHPKAWMNREIFKKWFFDDFVPSVRAHLRSKNLPQKAMLLLDNAPSHPNENELETEDGQIFVRYLPPNVTSLLQPMDQGVIEACKRRFRKIMLRLLLESDCSLKEFWKNWKIKDAIFAAAESWNDIPTVTLQRSWFNLWPSLKDDLNEIIGSEENAILPAQLLNGLQNLVEFENVSVDDVEEWLNSDLNEPGYQILEDSEIASNFSQPNHCMDTDDESVEEFSTQENTVSAEDALRFANGLMHYLEQENDTDYIDVLHLRKIRAHICLKMNNKKRQTKITDFFK